jgi:hypothetical protein
MAIKWPLANGVWSNAANWNDGTLPDVGDDVHADGKTVTIDQDVTVLSIRNDQRSGGTANGGFNFATTLTTYNITANLFSFNATLITLNQTGRIYNFTGNVESLFGTSASVNTILTTSATNTINIIGNINIVGGGTLRKAIFINQLGIVLNVTGNISSGDNNSSAAIYAIESASNAIINITGNITVNGNQRAVLTSNHISIILNSASNLLITGNVNSNLISNAGICLLVNSPNNFITINGIVTAKNSFDAIAGSIIINSFPNTLRIDKIVGSNNGSGVAVYNLIRTDVIVKEFEISSIGTVPAIGKIIVDDNTFAFKAINESNQTVIYSDNVLDFIPTEPNVRKNTTYYDGLKVGTLEVPDPSNVRKGVPTDNTVGTADLTAEDFWTYVTRSLTEAPDVPTAEEIATQVWEDQPERLKNVATVETTGDQISTI